MASTATLAPGLARKVKKILDIKTESPELLNSLATLSTFYTENTAGARRSLRTTIEKRGLDINQQFLTAAESVIQALDEVQSSLNALSENCGHITARLAVSKAASSQLLIETDKLQKECINVEHRSQMVTEFLDQFQLAPEEVAALQGEFVGPEFFKALERVRNIHENCRSLLRTHHQRAGLELMEMMALHQESAYDRLCRWVQAECRSIGEFDAPEVDPHLQTAVRALRERPVLFKYCAEEVASARHNALFQRFITALTRGGPGGLPRPIEIHAHDPKRYVNDMLAWVHQALASEREFVAALFGDAPATPTHREDAGESLDAAGLLDKVFESICRPLRVRVEQVLMSSPPLLLCFQLAQLLSFYASMVVKILGPHAQLSATLRTCKDMAHRIFFEQLKSRGEKMLRSVPAAPADLSPPPQLLEGIQQLQEMLAAKDAALVQEMEDGGDSEFRPVVSAALEPLIGLCQRSAEALQADAPSRVDEGTRMDPSRYHMYLINCFHAMHNALQSQAGSAQQAQQLLQMIEAQVVALVSGEVAALLGKSGVSEVVDRMRLYKSQGDAGRSFTSMAADPSLGLATVSEAMRSFFQLLSTSDALPEFLPLQAPRIRGDAVARVASMLADAYESVYTAVDDPTSGYGDSGAQAAIKHTPAQVRTILGVL